MRLARALYTRDVVAVPVPIRRMATNRAGGLGVYVDVDETMLNELCAANVSRIGADLTTLLDRTPPTASAMQPS